MDIVFQNLKCGTTETNNFEQQNLCKENALQIPCFEYRLTPLLHTDTE